MSGLRRSRPDEQDVVLRKLHDIKISHTNQQTDTGKSERTPSFSIESNSNVEKLKNDLEMKGLIGDSLAPLEQDGKEGFSFLELHKKNRLLSDKSNSDKDEPVLRVSAEPSSILRSRPDSYIQHIFPPSESPESLLSVTSPVLTRKIPKEIMRSGHLSVSPSVSPPFQTKRIRSGSEPSIGQSLQTASNLKRAKKLSKEWEKLHSILEVLKNEPFDVDSYLQSISGDLPEDTQLKRNSGENLCALQMEVSKLKESLQTMESEVKHIKSERDSALTYICDLKSAGQLPVNEMEDKVGLNQYYEEGIEGLRASEITKEQVLDIMVHLVKEFKGQKSYLERLMMVVITRAPWMLDEVDEAEMFQRSDSDDDDDDEVWC